MDFYEAFKRFQEFLKTNTEDNFTYDPQEDIVYLFNDIEQNKKFYRNFFEPNDNRATKVWVIGTTNNTGRSLDAVGVRILESGYNNQQIKDRHPLFGGYTDKRTGKKFLDISIPVTTSKGDAVRRAKDQIQDIIVGISSSGRRETIFLPKRAIPVQGSEPVF